MLNTKPPSSCTTSSQQHLHHRSAPQYLACCILPQCAPCSAAHSTQHAIIRCNIHSCAVPTHHWTGCDLTHHQPQTSQHSFAKSMRLPTFALAECVQTKVPFRLSMADNLLSHATNTDLPSVLTTGSPCTCNTSSVPECNAIWDHSHCIGCQRTKPLAS